MTHFTGTSLKLHIFDFHYNYFDNFDENEKGFKILKVP